MLEVVAMDNYGARDLFLTSWDWSNEQVIENLPGNGWEGNPLMTQVARPWYADFLA
ncbi:MAG: hypothetical protein Ct9H300mP16_16700 [Pseudomonadota bacterium]|nr:MAG: hypothetical protein Ct9H300mP16_16700 [Pseudomonadota bacterium]